VANLALVRLLASVRPVVAVEPRPPCERRLAVLALAACDEDDDSANRNGPRRGVAEVGKRLTSGAHRVSFITTSPQAAAPSLPRAQFFRSHTSTGTSTSTAPYRHVCRLRNQHNARLTDKHSRYTSNTATNTVRGGVRTHARTRLWIYIVAHMNPRLFGVVACKVRLAHARGFDVALLSTGTALSFASGTAVILCSASSASSDGWTQVLLPSWRREWLLLVVLLLETWLLLLLK
jgi:hypothetical protein